MWALMREHIGLAKRFIQVFPLDIMEKLRTDFLMQTQLMQNFQDGNISIVVPTKWLLSNSSQKVLGKEKHMGLWINCRMCKKKLLIV